MKMNELEWITTTDAHKILQVNFVESIANDGLKSWRFPVSIANYLGFRFIEACKQRKFVQGDPCRADLLRELIGNPCRIYRCSWCAGDSRASHENDDDLCPLCAGTGGIPKRWKTPTVTGLAERIHDTNDYSLMPLLADALIDSNCTDAYLIEHCRGQDPCPCSLLRGMRPCSSCGGRGPVYAYTEIKACDGCGSMESSSCFDCKSGWIPLRIEHARGCWAIRAILGKDNPRFLFNKTKIAEVIT